MNSSRHCLQCSALLPAELGSEVCSNCQVSTSRKLFDSATPHSFQDEQGNPELDLAGRNRRNAEPPTTLRTSPAQPESTTIAIPDDSRIGHASTVDAAANSILADAPSTRTPETLARLPSAPPGYTLLRRLGHGSMGDVYLAREEASERQVALKFLRAPGNPAAVERFQIEVRALARLEHHNIVKIYATDFFCLVPFFTMEYVSGGTLSRRISSKSPLSPAEAASLMSAVARGVQAAHEANVLHRDIKPNNILLGPDGTPKVADFGLAKRTDQEDSLSLGTGPIGTASYMPPEQVSRRYGEIGPHSDVYSLGATLYHLLSGQPPFCGESSHDIAVKVTMELPPRLRSIRGDVPAGLEAIAMKCLEKDPTDRYASAAALAEDLDCFLAGEEPEAPRLTRARRLRRWTGRRRLQVGAAALTLIAVALIGMNLRRDRAATDFTPRAIETNVSLGIEPNQAIRLELAEGKIAKLLNADGLPRWKAWPIQSANLTGSPDDGGTCSFSSRDARVLLLLDDPGLTRYRVSLEVCEREKSGLLEKAQINSSFDSVGLVVGFAMQPGAENTKVYSMELLGYSEFDDKGTAPNKRMIQISDLAAVEKSPVLLKDLPRLRGPNAPISPILPGPPWRKLAVDITPEAISGVEPRLSRPHPFGDIAQGRASVASKVAKGKANGAGLPNWSPRMPLGIWCKDATVAFRNVTIEALN